MFFFQGTKSSLGFSKKQAFLSWPEKNSGGGFHEQTSTPPKKLNPQQIALMVTSFCLFMIMACINSVFWNFQEEEEGRQQREGGV